MSFNVNVRVNVQTRTRLAFAVARVAYVACRIVTLTPAESQRVAMRLVVRLSRYRVGNGPWQRFGEVD